MIRSTGKLRLAADVRWTMAAIGVVGLLGGAVTEIGPWYFALTQPPWKPPDWVFGPAWMLIYLCTGWAGVRTWRRLPTGNSRSGYLVACAINGLLNVLWSLLYFTMRRPDWALSEGIALWLSILWVTALTARVDRLGAWLMSPYIVWVAVALALNFETLRLNPALTVL